MFERYTDRARRIVVSAQEEARALESPTINTEHLLLGILYDPEGIASILLAERGVELVCARETAIGLYGSEYVGTIINAHVPFTNPAKTALENALHESNKLGHRHIGGEHFLLGLISVSNRATEVLEMLDVDVEELREAIHKKINESSQ